MIWFTRSVAALAVGIGRACRRFCSCRAACILHGTAFEGSVEAVVGKETKRGAPIEGCSARQGVRRAFDSELGRRNGARVCATAETVGDKENKGAALENGRGKEPKEWVFIAVPGPDDQGRERTAPSIERSWVTGTGSNVEATVSRADVGADSPIKALKHRKCPSDSKVAEGVGVA